MNKKLIINHYNLGDIMIYFFINVMMYLVIIVLLLEYFKERMDRKIMIIILFNMNTYLFFIYKDINFFYGILVLIVSLILYYFSNLFDKTSKEIILIKNGNINFHDLVNYYSYHKLITYLKIHRIKLDEVAYLILKNKRITVIKKNT